MVRFFRACIFLITAVGLFLSSRTLFRNIFASLALITLELSKSDTPVFPVYQDGTLCLDIIQNKWSPSYTVSSVLTSIQSLLTDPNCGSPANPEAAELYLQDRKAYNRRVRRLTEESLGAA
jgi:hypothetical protein